MNSWQNCVSSYKHLFAITSKFNKLENYIRLGRIFDTHIRSQFRCILKFILYERWVEKGDPPTPIFIVQLCVYVLIVFIKFHCRIFCILYSHNFSLLNCYNIRYMLWLSLPGCAFVSQFQVNSDISLILQK